MRKWHRWTTVFVGLFMLFIALTGLGSHFAAIYARGSLFESEEREGQPPAASAPAAGATASAPPAPTSAPTTAAVSEGAPASSAATASSAPVPAPPPATAAATASAPPASPTPNPARRLVGLFHHLHSGEFFGPVGVVISILSGFALVFFAVSGMWMYVQMFRNRRSRGRREIFWK